MDYAAIDTYVQRAVGVLQIGKGHQPLAGPAKHCSKLKQKQLKSKQKPP